MGLVEVSSPCMHTAYFAKLHKLRGLYFVSGIFKITLYPVTRLLFIPWIMREVLLNIPLFEEECPIMVPFSISAGAFIFLISAYHTVVNFYCKMSQHLYLREKTLDDHGATLLGGRRSQRAVRDDKERLLKSEV